MAKERPPDELARRIFLVTMVGIDRSGSPPSFVFVILR